MIVTQPPRRWFCHVRGYVNERSVICTKLVNHTGMHSDNGIVFTDDDLVAVKVRSD